jgi:cytochrome c
MKIRALATTLLLLAAAPALAQNADKRADKSAALRGEALVAKLCGSCHAVGAGDVSPNARATPMQEIARKYNPEDLEEAFAEGVMVGHEAPEMPAFEFDPPQIDELVSYLKALRAK